MSKGKTLRRIAGSLLLCGSLLWMGLASAPVAGAGPRAHHAMPVEHKCGAGGRALCGKVTVPLDRTGHVPGTLRIGYERYPHTDRSRPGLETVVAIEGGPGSVSYTHLTLPTKA